MVERVRAVLILYYGIDTPTEKQIAEFILFGQVGGSCVKSV